MPRTYTVQGGDSPASIAGKLYGDQRMFAELLAANGGAPFRPGMTIVVPDQIANPNVSNETAAAFGMATSGQNASWYNSTEGAQKLKMPWTATKDAFGNFLEGTDAYNNQQAAYNVSRGNFANLSDALAGTNPTAAGKALGTGGAGSGGKLQYGDMEFAGDQAGQPFGYPAQKVWNTTPQTPKTTPKISSGGGRKDKGVGSNPVDYFGTTGSKTSVASDLGANWLENWNKGVKMWADVLGGTKPGVSGIRGGVNPAPSGKGGAAPAAPSIKGAKGNATGGVKNDTQDVIDITQLHPDVAKMIVMDGAGAITGFDTPDVVTSDQFDMLSRIAGSPKVNGQVVDPRISFAKKLTDNGYIKDYKSGYWYYKPDEAAAQSGAVAGGEVAPSGWWGGYFGLSDTQHTYDDTSWTGRPSDVTLKSLANGNLNFRVAFG